MHRFLHAFIVVLVALAVGPTPVHAEAPDRPKVALVLSGGGARGFAHIGVLRTLKELRVPVDMVVGVSMGAVIGGAYSAGRTPEELADFVRRTDWTSIVADRPPRDDLLSSPGRRPHGAVAHRVRHRQERRHLAARGGR